MSYFFIDAHAHLSDPRFGDDHALEQVIKRADSVGIKKFILGGVCPVDWHRQKILKEKYPDKVYTVFGIHPWWIKDHTEAEIKQAYNELESSLSLAIALGETGLDFGAKGESKNKMLQMEYFKKQLLLAKKQDLPLVLHVVRSHEVVLETLKEMGPFPRAGLVHSFSGGVNEAMRYMQMGFTLSVSGAVTKKRGFDSLKEAVKLIAGEYLTVETDSPDQKPVEWGGIHNEPTSLILISKAIASLRGESHEDVLLRSAENLIKIFRI